MLFHLESSKEEKDSECRFQRRYVSQFTELLAGNFDLRLRHTLPFFVITITLRYTCLLYSKKTFMTVVIFGHVLFANANTAMIVYNGVLDSDVT